MVRVDGDSFSFGHRFTSDEMLLVLYPAVHIRVGGFGPPPSEGLRGPLRRPGALRSVRTVGPTVWLIRSHVSFPRSPVAALCLTWSRQRAGAEAGLKGRLSQRLPPAQSQVDGLVFELVQVCTTG